MAWEGTDSLTMEQAFNIFTGTDQGARGHSWDSDTWRTQTTRDMGEAIRDAGSALEQRFASATYHPLALEARKLRGLVRS